MDDKRDVLSALPHVPVARITTAAEFEAVVAAARPLVLQGIINHWPALAAGRTSSSALNAYLKAMDSGLPGSVMEASASAEGRFGYSADLREFTYSKRQCGVSETLDRIERQLDRSDGSVIAIQMLPLASHMPGFAQRNPMALLPNAEPRLWVGGRVRTQIHNDRDHNLACVIAGRRRFILFPPEQVENLYIGPIENPPPLSLVDLESPDLNRFPRFERAIAAAQAAELAPGDAIFMPRYWWHHVTSRDGYNAMINYWWGGSAPGLDDPANCFLLALLAFKELPEPARLYWRSLLQIHVFGTHGADHIPEGLRGVLGELNPHARTLLKRRLKTLFIGSS